MIKVTSWRVTCGLSNLRISLETSHSLAESAFRMGVTHGQVSDLENQMKFFFNIPLFYWYQLCTRLWITVGRPGLWFFGLLQLSCESCCYLETLYKSKAAHEICLQVFRLSEYLRHTQHNWGWSWLHLFCITVKQTMKKLSAASSKVLLSVCHLLTWFLQVGKTVQAILCSSFCFKLKMLQDYYVMRHHEKYPFRRSDWHFPPASAQCHSSMHCWYLCRHCMRSSRAGRDVLLCSLTCTE